MSECFREDLETIHHICAPPLPRPPRIPFLTDQKLVNKRTSVICHHAVLVHETKSAIVLDTDVHGRIFSPLSSNLDIVIGRRVVHDVQSIAFKFTL